jgi:opacity protein-like surface antigen
LQIRFSALENTSKGTILMNAIKKLMLLGVGLILCAIPSRAQSQFDASVGYSYFHLGGGADLSQNGISGSFAYKPIPFLGIVGDIGGYHGSVAGQSLDTYTFMFGPRIYARNPTKVTPFFQFLAGEGHLTAGNGGGSSNNFAYSVGGGVDVGVLPHLAIRPQIDYVGLHNAGGTAGCTRVSVSAVVHF